MKIDDNGFIREMTPAEVKAMEEANQMIPIPGPSTEERVTDLEKMFGDIKNGIEDIKKLLRGGR